MAGETWKSHQMTTRERDMDMDHAQQLGDVDTAAAIHDEWMFGDDETVWGDEDPAFRLTIANYPGGMTLVTHLSPAGIVEALARRRCRDRRSDRG